MVRGNPPHFQFSTRSHTFRITAMYPVSPASSSAAAVLVCLEVSRFPSSSAPYRVTTSPMHSSNYNRTETAARSVLRSQRSGRVLRMSLGRFVRLRVVSGMPQRRKSYPYRFLQLSFSSIRSGPSVSGDSRFQSWRPFLSVSASASTRNSTGTDTCTFP